MQKRVGTQLGASRVRSGSHAPVSKPSLRSISPRVPAGGTCTSAREGVRGGATPRSASPGTRRILGESKAFRVIAPAGVPLRNTMCITDVDAKVPGPSKGCVVAASRVGEKWLRIQSGHCLPFAQDGTPLFEPALDPKPGDRIWSFATAAAQHQQGAAAPAPAAAATSRSATSATRPKARKVSKSPLIQPRDARLGQAKQQASAAAAAASATGPPSVSPLNLAPVAGVSAPPVLSGRRPRRIPVHVPPPPAAGGGGGGVVEKYTAAATRARKDRGGDDARRAPPPPPANAAAEAAGQQQQQRLHVVRHEMRTITPRCSGSGSGSGSGSTRSSTAVSGPTRSPSPHLPLFVDAALLRPAANQLREATSVGREEDRQQRHGDDDDDCPQLSTTQPQGAATPTPTPTPTSNAPFLRTLSTVIAQANAEADARGSARRGARGDGARQGPLAEQRPIPLRRVGTSSPGSRSGSGGGGDRFERSPGEGGGARLQQGQEEGRHRHGVSGPQRGESSSEGSDGLTASELADVTTLKDQLQRALHSLERGERPVRELREAYRAVKQLESCDPSASASPTCTSSSPPSDASGVLSRSRAASDDMACDTLLCQLSEMMEENRVRRHTRSNEKLVVRLREEERARREAEMQLYQLRMQQQQAPLSAALRSGSAERDTLEANSPCPKACTQVPFPHPIETTATRYVWDEQRYSTGRAVETTRAIHIGGSTIASGEVGVVSVSACGTNAPHVRICGFVFVPEAGQIKASKSYGYVQRKPVQQAETARVEEEVDMCMPPSEAPAPEHSPGKSSPEQDGSRVGLRRVHGVQPEGLRRAASQAVAAQLLEGSLPDCAPESVQRVPASGEDLQQKAYSVQAQSPSMFSEAETPQPAQPPGVRPITPPALSGVSGGGADETPMSQHSSSLVTPCPAYQPQGHEITL